MRYLSALWCACVAIGCDKDGGAVGLVELCPRSSEARVAAGDSNGDGAVDLADPLHLLRYVADGGAAPSCEVAVDLLIDEQLDADDAFALLAYLYEDLWDLPPVEGDDCGRAAASEAACAEVGFGLVADEASGVVTVELSSEQLAVEGWSLALSAEGCSLGEVSVQGTAGAPLGLDEAGLRELGYELTVGKARGVASAVVLDTLDAVALPTDGVARPLLRVETVADGGCGTCTVSVGEAVRGWGQPVESTLVAAGVSYPLPVSSVSFERCP